MTNLKAGTATASAPDRRPKDKWSRAFSVQVRLVGGRSQVLDDFLPDVLDVIV